MVLHEIPNNFDSLYSLVTKRIVMPIVCIAADHLLALVTA